MRYPKFLEKGGTIGFVAPSFGCNIEPYRTAFGHALIHSMLRAIRRSLVQIAMKAVALVSVIRRRNAVRRLMKCTHQRKMMF